MALNRYRLKHLAKEGHRGARLTTQLLVNTDRLLGVILLGNNLLNAASATLVAVIVSVFFGHSDLALLIRNGSRHLRHSGVQRDYTQGDCGRLS